MVIIRFSLASRTSRRRIRSLEENESYAQQLVHVVAQLEKQLEDMVVDFVEDPDSGSESDATIGAVHHSLPQHPGSVAQQPILKEVQKVMIKSLNALPGLKKERAFFESVRNSHAIIISRDPRKFKIHELGQEILNHWADNFLF